MTNKGMLLVILIIAFINGTYAQDSLLNDHPQHDHPQLKTGLYFTKEEFFQKRPSLDKPFRVVPIYKKKNDTTSILFAYTFQLLDSSIKPKKVYGFFDGKSLYIGANGQHFSKLIGVGKYPYLIDTFKINYTDFGSPLRLLVSLADQVLSSPKEVIYFYNKKKKCLEATTVSIALLLKDDKDFAGEFHKEKIKNNAAYIKYLNKMNELYLY